MFFGSFSGTQNFTKLQDFFTMPWPRHKCKQCRKWVSRNITWNAFFADVFRGKLSFSLRDLMIFSPKLGNHGKAQVAGLSWLSSFQERNVRYCLVLTSVSQERWDIQNSLLLSFLVILGACMSVLWRHTGTCQHGWWNQVVPSCLDPRLVGETPFGNDSVCSSYMAQQPAVKVCVGL